MAVDTPSVFAAVIQEHLELKRRNSALEHEMPLEKYMNEDPFENHPLFKTEEQARIEETMDGVEGIESHVTSLDWPTTEDTFIEEPQARSSSGRHADDRAARGRRRRARRALRRESLVALPRLRLGRLTLRGGASGSPSLTHLPPRRLQIPACSSTGSATTS